MALVKCSECGGDVSTQASACPKCGAPPSPAVSPTTLADLPSENWHLLSPRGQGWLVLLICLGLLSLIIVAVRGDRKTWGPPARAQIGEPPPSAAEQAKEAAHAAAVAASCKADIPCYGNKHIAGATQKCRPEIERHAKYSLKWLDGATFTSAQWAPQAQTAITYLGDRIQFQNGFGAWQNMNYECDYDGETQQVLATRVHEGRL